MTETRYRFEQDEPGRKQSNQTPAAMFLENCTAHDVTRVGRYRWKADGSEVSHPDTLEGREQILVGVLGLVEGATRSAYEEDAAGFRLIALDFPSPEDEFDRRAHRLEVHFNPGA